MDGRGRKAAADERFPDIQDELRRCRERQRGKGENIG